MMDLNHSRNLAARPLTCFNSRTKQIAKIKWALFFLAALCSLFTALNPAIAQTWMPTSAPVTNWWGCVSSPDGSKLVACFGYGSGGRIYTSGDSGTTWIETSAPDAFWEQIVSTADGTKIAALGFFNNAQSGRVYISTNSGTDWQLAGPTEPFLNDVGCSADGSILAETGDSGIKYLSKNWGVSWTIASALPVLPFWGEAFSADGRKLVKLSFPGISVSTNSGVTWSLTSAPTNEEWDSVASSADGNILAATSYAPTDTNNTVILGRGSIYTSADSGATWNSNSTPDVISWNLIVSSADGSQLVALSDDRETVTSRGAARIYILKSTPAPVLGITSSGGNSIIAWTIPSMSFGLQQNSNLATTNWTDMTNPPTVLNLTNLQNQVTVSRTNSSRFFRLVH